MMTIDYPGGDRGCMQHISVDDVLLLFFYLSKYPLLIIMVFYGCSDSCATQG